jgi:membrane protein YqaA with SNARE-associated domain
MYDWAMRSAETPNAERTLAAVSFAESSFFPLPPDALLIPMVLARPDRAWRLAAICTVASVVGGLLGYAIGAALYETVGLWLVRVYHLEHAFENFRAGFDQYGAAIILIKGLTPIPYKLVTIASGVAHFSLPLFMVTSIITRGARFFLVALLLRLYGPPIRTFIEKRLTLVTTAFVLVIVLGFVIVLKG